jgi:hypothetical protein
VKCLACELDKIPRGSFSDHVSKVCTTTNVSCLASDILCSWNGPRYQLEDHLKSCPYQQIRPALEMMQAKNIHLEQLLNNQQQQIANINERSQAQQDQINELITMIKSMKGMWTIRMTAEVHYCHSFVKLDEHYNVVLYCSS